MHNGRRLIFKRKWFNVSRQVYSLFYAEDYKRSRTEWLISQFSGPHPQGTESITLNPRTAPHPHPHSHLCYHCFLIDLCE